MVVCFILKNKVSGLDVYLKIVFRCWKWLFYVDDNLESNL